MTSWKDLHKLPIGISRKYSKPVFESRHQKSSGYGPQNLKNAEYILQAEKGLVISS